MGANCTCGGKAFRLASILLNSSSAACVDFGMTCIDCGTKRVEELRKIYRQGTLKQLKAALQRGEAIEVLH